MTPERLSEFLDIADNQALAADPASWPVAEAIYELAAERGRLRAVLFNLRADHIKETYELREKNIKLMDRVGDLEHILKWYADSDNYKIENRGSFEVSPSQRDLGTKARNVLNAS